MHTADHDIFKWLLTMGDHGPPEKCETRMLWLKQYQSLAGRWPLAIDRAIAGGYLSDRMAWAFASGYQAALHRLFPHLPEKTIAAFCVSEKNGNHPRAILTRLEPSGDGFVLNGRKTFVTGAMDADLLFVAASVGRTKAGQNKLKLAAVKTRAGGLTFTPMADLPIIPELPHCALKLENVRVTIDDVCKGDGYPGYVKPFRTIEDIHVCAAVTGYIFRLGMQYNWPETDLQQILSLALMLRSLSLKDPLSPHVHIILGGVLSHLDPLLSRISGLMENSDPDAFFMWQRDKPVFNIAAKARQQRLSAAWAMFTT